MRQGVHPRSQTPQGESVAKPEIPLLIILSITCKWGLWQHVQSVIRKVSAISVWHDIECASSFTAVVAVWTYSMTTVTSNETTKGIHATSYQNHWAPLVFISPWEVLIQDKHLLILHGQYHGCWCPGNARSQGSSNHDIDYVEPN